MIVVTSTAPQSKKQKGSERNPQSKFLFLHCLSMYLSICLTLMIVVVMMVVEMSLF